MKNFLPLTFACPRVRLGLVRCIQRGPCLNGLLPRRAIPLKTLYFTKSRGNLNEWPPTNLVQSFLLVLQPTLLKKRLHTAGRTLVLTPPVRTITRPIPRVRKSSFAASVSVERKAKRPPTAPPPNQRDINPQTNMRNLRKNSETLAPTKPRYKTRSNYPLRGG